MTKIKLWIAGLLNRSGRYCWTELVSWATGTSKWSEVDKHGGEKCKAASLGDFCYCGKFYRGELNK